LGKCMKEKKVFLAHIYRKEVRSKAKGRFQSTERKSKEQESLLN